MRIAIRRWRVCVVCCFNLGWEHNGCWQAHLVGWEWQSKQKILGNFRDIAF